MPIDDAAWAAAVDRLCRARRVSLACHVDPDGDALGSMLALHRLLRRRGVDVSASWGTTDTDEDARAGTSLVVPPQYTFLPELSALVPPADLPEDVDVLVVFDCASPERLGSLRRCVDAAGCVIVLDHHATGQAFGDVQLIDGSAAATAVIVDELVRRMDEELDREMAICLYVALVTDTGRFSYASTTPAVMTLAARLLSHDIDHATINRRVFETHSFGYLKVLGRALERATLVPSSGLTWTAVTQDDLSDLGITMAEVEGLIDVLRSVEVAQCALVCKEQADGSWKGSLRSRGRIDVGEVAEALGGGGHAYAAGFIARGALEDVVGDVAKLLRDQLDVAAHAADATDTRS